MRKNLKQWGLLWTGVMLVAILVAACAGDPEAPVSATGSTPSVAVESDATVFPESTEIIDRPVLMAKTGNAVGERVPEFVINVSSGESISTSQLLADGKPVFLFFMATW